ncbi:MAG: 30S ribosomal protein S3 [archaeon]|nr:MAG: 30S ribosomal protein S3 [archaeon]
MIEKKFIESKKQEFEIKEFIKKKFGKGKISEVRIERTPVGEKIVITTTRRGIVIGRAGENIQGLTTILKRRFKLENPQIEVLEVENPEFDAATIADRIAVALERFGQLSFKLIAYRELDRLMKAGALGAEIRLSGRLPSERAKSHRFAFGYLKKTGESRFIVNKKLAIAKTKPGVVGVKVSIVPRDTKIPDKIDIDYTKIKEEIKEEIKKEEKKKNGRNKKK